VYREALNYDHTPELHETAISRLRQLQEIDPNVKLTPLGDVHLGGHGKPVEKLPQRCPQCWLHHAGECP
jgi:hypothetical protein